MWLLSSDGVHDPLDHGRVAHARHPTGLANVGGHAFERHDGDGAGVFGNLRLIGRDDIHDDAALEHLGQTLLGRPGGGLDGHVGFDPLVSALGSPAGSGPGVVARSSRPSPSRVRIIARGPSVAHEAHQRQAATRSWHTIARIVAGTCSFQLYAVEWPIRVPHDDGASRRSSIGP
jgi:hypothetical protein